MPKYKRPDGGLAGMEIECQGCYYTLCSFVCLTEDLSEILQFLWRHGCLRRSYSCDKCGRKCAIGDKDLFFRCNRNAVESELAVPPPAPPPPPLQRTLHLTDMSMDCHVPPPVQLQSNGDSYVLPPTLQPLPHSHHLHHPMTHPYLLPLPQLGHDGIVLVHRVEGVTEQEALHHDQDSSRLITVIDGHGSRVVQATEAGCQTIHSMQTLTCQSQAPHHQKPEDEANHKQLKRPLPKGDSNCKSIKKRCNFKVSMKKGTFFEKSKLPIDTVCKFVAFWCCMRHPTQEFLRNELSLATRTVVDWSTACRDICIHWARSVSEKIGGDGVIVQIDEVKIQESKDATKPGPGATDTVNRFSFWGMEKDKEKGKLFIVPVPACDSWSLLNVVNDWVLPGSVIISNCWKSYDCLKLQEFIQQTIVQSKTFVHPQNNAGQHSFDAKPDETGSGGLSNELQMPRFGTRRSHHLGDLAEFMFKRRFSNHLERMHVFFKQVALSYPLR